MRSRMANVEYDVITVKGMAIAKADRAEVRGLRTGLESLRKQIKAPALAHCKLIDDEARRITAELLKLETPIDEQIKAREAALEAEKVAREAVERARISEIHARISEIRGYHALALQCRTADAVQKLIDRLTDVELTGFEEFDDEAKATRASTMLEMERILGQKQVDEAEQVRIKAEQAEAAEKLAHERKLMEEERAAIQASLDAQRAEIEKQKAAIAHTAIEPAATEIDLVVDAEVKPDDVLVLTDEMVSIPLVTERPTAEELIQVIAA